MNKKEETRAGDVATVISIADVELEETQAFDGLSSHDIWVRRMDHAEDLEGGLKRLRSTKEYKESIQNNSFRASELIDEGIEKVDEGRGDEGVHDPNDIWDFTQESMAITLLAFKSAYRLFHEAKDLLAE